ncbi:MAG: PIN domain-containing protein [Actinomycetota bacterium]|nr:PIN domain-containing protein [Actinomycetota bacterium]
MSGRSFIDTNVLVYAFDSSEPEKQQMALEALAKSGDRSVLSTQVLSEFYVVATRKLANPVASRVAADVVDQLSRLPIVDTDTSLVRSAIDISVRSQISYWDGLIVAAAIASGCDRILTEDLSTGATFNGVEIVNPFVV